MKRIFLNEVITLNHTSCFKRSGVQPWYGFITNAPGYLTYGLSREQAVGLVFIRKLRWHGITCRLRNGRNWEGWIHDKLVVVRHLAMHSDWLTAVTWCVDRRNTKTKTQGMDPYDRNIVQYAIKSKYVQDNIKYDSNQKEKKSNIGKNPLHAERKRNVPQQE